MKLFGLIGYPLSHSFSKQWFTKKFAHDGLTDILHYDNFPLQTITGLSTLLEEHPEIRGFNVTAPHKETIIPYLDQTDITAKEIGAVNCVIRQSNVLKGYNVDWIGFSRSLTEFIGNRRPEAIILGTGGAAKAAAYALSQLYIDYIFVSRNAGAKPHTINYTELCPKIIASHKLIINATPLGTYPNVSAMPPIPYEMLSEEHFLYDMVYNPAETAFMKHGKANGATVTNGLRMLELQAEESWKLFSSTL